MNKSVFFKLAFFATCLAFVVILLGAYTRLGDAGLGCPDWPGCYGHIGVPDEHHEITKANEAYPERPVEAHKAWKEMVHRYFAGTLGLVVFAIGIIAIRNRHQVGQQFKLPVFLMGLIVFQAALGMWTVTIKLHPTIVMMHLMGGMTTFSILWWLTLRSGKLFKNPGTVNEDYTSLHKLALVALVIVVIQVMLGGWTSATYSALHCNEFPTCTGGKYLPAMNFKEGFDFIHEFGHNYEFGLMSNEARIAIHTTHRIGAIVTFLFTIWLGLKILRNPAYQSIRKIGMVMIALVIVQFLLGISNVVFSLPLLVAVAHNGGGALLIITMVTLNHLVHKQS